MIKRKDGRWQEQIKLPGMERPKYFYGRTQRKVQRKLAAWSVEREQEYMDNMPENLQASERYERAEDAVDSMNYALDNLSDAMENLEDAIG